MPPRVTSDVFDAVLFDMDGVLTSTARLHAACWKQTFDAFLSGWDADHGSTTAPFSISDDYVAWVDGKPREDGVRDFLWTRGIVLPEGLADAPAGEASVWGLGNWKQALVEEALRSE